MDTADDKPMDALHAELAPTLLLDHVRLLYAQSLVALLVNGSVASGLVYLSRVGGAVPEGGFLWLGGMWIVLLLRTWGLIVYRRRGEATLATAPRWMRWHVCGVLAVAVLWGLWAPLFFAKLDVSARAFTTVVICAMTSGGVAVLAASRALAASFCCLLLVPPTLWLLLLGEGASERTLGMLGCVYLVAMFFSVMTLSGSVTRALRLSRVNQHLSQLADSQRAATEQSNARLAQAEQALLTANQELEGRVQQRTTELQREVAERVRYQRELERMARSDALTGLLNRSGLNLVLDAALQRREVEGSALALLFVDLDRFKEVNDGLGHAAGDLVLRTVAQRLSLLGETSALGENLLACARWGGDEFVLLLSGDTAAAQALAETLLASLGAPIAFGDGVVRIGGSIGIALAPEHGRDAQTLIRHADLAMYAAKSEHGDQARVYWSALGAESQRRVAMHQALRGCADSGDGLTLMFQPIVDLEDGRVRAVEALARWRHSEFGPVAPDVFIPLAEENGSIIALGYRLLEMACRSVCGLPSSVSVAVNLSMVQLLQHDCVDRIEAVLAASGLAPQRLELELTESVFALDGAHVGAVLSALRARGVRVAIDDFGSGYSSLAYLRRFPADVLKVDRSFISALDQGGEAIIAAALSMARAFGLELVVEGVETSEQLERVRRLGARRAQGYYFARPQSAAALADWLHARAAARIGLQA
ncbi:diguanylate cyclase/phosphodiesterase [Plasticicumulans acidivorans]|uniref:Diguanylate cyclase/phosphodiesterase n=2 Tax=Plasticicumulans acidivorans TaxID=886464 RepID=A0A317MY55_9GAMM|nr:diguanylate cyclase/phosphodiesterase [Plasticicumulans acidivorans]